MKITLVVLVALFCLINVIKAEPKGPFCCNKCPRVKVTVVPVYKTHVFTITVPYPVFKPLPTSVLTKCPPHFEKVSKRKCVHYVKTKDTCPPGYFRVSDDSCLKVVVLPEAHPHFKVKCPKGYTNYGELGCKIGTKHEKKYPKLPKVIHPEAPKVHVELPKPTEEIKCPAGFVKKGKYHCVKTLHCPKGYKQTVNGECEKLPVKCPVGYTRLEDQCIKSLKFCPRGFNYNSKAHCCEKKSNPRERIYRDKCDMVDCPQLKCKAGEKPVKNAGECCAKCAKCGCGSKFEPVCGKDGVTYPNKCTAKCLSKPIQGRGACQSQCRGSKRSCPSYYKPVCGKDGVTYKNRCTAGVAGAEVAKSGPCAKKCVV